GPFIAVRPPCHEGKHSPSAWKMTNAMPSWSWRGCEGKQTHVEVYARAANVELKVNGASKGKKPMGKNCVFTFRVPYENGVIEAISYDENGSVIGQTQLATAEPETVLRAAPEESSVQKGHLAFVRLQFTDPNGVVKPMERDILHVKIKGGTLCALGSACPYYELSYLDSKCDTYYGEALAIVRVEADTVIEASCGKGTCEAKIACIE
ncbi:MAG: DUF4982 domain-containing protein, partial [Clostridia bacterium]|nr:DUF4982 domain-containing protein [Clostridia bacterium]